MMVFTYYFIVLNTVDMKDKMLFIVFILFCFIVHTFFYCFKKYVYTLSPTVVSTVDHFICQNVHTPYSLRLTSVTFIYFISVTENCSLNAVCSRHSLNLAAWRIRFLSMLKRTTWSELILSTTGIHADALFLSRWVASYSNKRESSVTLLVDWDKMQ